MKGIFYTYFLLGSLILMGLKGLGQPSQLPFNLNYIPPSASAASLGKFGDIPVGLYTGIPNISVPVYSYKGISNGLALNVALAYHAGGIRVEEVGGNIGMGWALDAGGVITRTMRGQPDDLPTNGYIALKPIQVLNEAGLSSAEGPTVLNTFVENGYDSQLDEFDFNFGGNSGKFILDTLGNPVLINQQNIVIQSIPNPAPGSNGLPLQGFIARDRSGTKYIFTDAETTYISVSTLYGTTYSSSWYLTAIVNPFSSDTIKFTYNIASENYQTFSEDTRQNSLTDGQPGVTAVTISSQPSNYSISAKKIKTITFPNQVTLNFFYQPITRCDLIGDSVLSQIEQIDRVTGSTRSLYLYQSYIDQYGIYYPFAPAPCNTSSIEGSTALRLRLDSVRELSGSLTLPPYVFEYNDTFLLPTRNSRLEDFWGYDNGSHNTTGTLVPFYFWQGTSSYFLDGADRRTDSEAVKAGSLIQVKYPTGGTTTFNYEVNRAGDNKLIIKVPTFGNQGVGSTFAFGDSTTGSVQMTINQSPSNVPINFSFAMGGWCPGLPTVATIVFSITSLNGSTTYATESFTYSEIETTKTYLATIPNGTYLLTWQINSPPSISNVCDEAFGFSLVYQYSFADSTQLAGGIRIASTVDYDGISHQNDVTRRYSYIDTTGISSGTGGSFINFGYDYTACVNPDDPLPYFMRASTTTQPLAYTEGSPVGYYRVEVATTGPANIGKEVDYFSSFRDYPSMGGSGQGGVNFGPPQGPPIQPLDFALGLPTLKEIYNGNGVLQKKVVNTYGVSYSELDYLPSFNMAILQQANADYDGEPVEYSSSQYYWFNGFSQKLQSSTTEYTATGDSIVNQISYNYDPVYLDDVTQETRVDSKGDTIIDYHYYPFDYTIAGSVFGAMVDSNMITQRISNERWKRLNGSYYLVSADATNYSKFASGVFPANYYLLNSSQPVSQSAIGAFNSNLLLRNPSLYFQQLSFDSYDPKGNPAQLTQKSKVTNYIWDINRQFPIAKVNNADTSYIAYTSFEADGSGGWTIGGGNVNTTGGITGSNSYSLNGSGNITKSGLNSANAYVVSYWTQSTTPLTIAGTISGYPLQGKTINIGGNTWTYFEHQVTGQNTVSISGSATIDELRLYPVTSQMQTYTYSPLFGITSQCDVDNRVTYYSYDLLGRLQYVRDQDGNIIKTYQYHYQGQ